MRYQTSMLVWLVSGTAFFREHFLCIYMYWSHIMLLSFVKLNTVLTEKGSHKRYAMSIALVVVCVLWSSKMFIWSKLHWWALKELNCCCLQTQWMQIKTMRNVNLRKNRNKILNCVFFLNWDSVHYQA